MPERATEERREASVSRDVGFIYLGNRIDNLDAKIETRIDAVRNSLDKKIEAMRESLKAEIEDLRKKII